MAKLWNEEKVGSGTLVRCYSDDVKDLVIDINDLFEDFYMLEVVQRATIINGLKQKIADSIARSKDAKLTEAEKRDVQETLWLRISVDKEWNMPKATGARGPAVSYKVIIPALEASGLDAEVIAATLSTTLERVQPFMTPEEEITE